MKKHLLVVIFLLFIVLAKAQNIGVNTSGATPNLSALLDIDAAGLSPKLGLLIPRFTFAERTGIVTLLQAAQGLVVYQTDGVQGFYYNTSTTTTPAWSYLSPSNAGWTTAGNTLSGTEWIGSINAYDWVVKTNSIENMRIQASTGNLGIGTTNPTYPLTLGASGIVFGIENTARFAAKNSAGTYEQYLWPRWSDNIMYLNYGSGGFNIRNSSSVNTMFMTNSGNVGIGTATPAQTLHVVGTARVSTLASGASGAIVTTNASGDMSVTNFSGNANQVLLGNNTFGAVPTNTAWSLTGNTGTTVGTNFIGTIAGDNQPLMIKVNGQKSGYIDYDATIANTALGFQAANATTGAFNTAVGYSALLTNTTGTNNTAVGYQSLKVSNGNQNTAVGVSSLSANTGSQNTAIGYLSSSYNTSGKANTAMGLGTLEYNAIGDSNVAVGFYALRGAAVGSNQINNVALGSYAGLKNNSGTNNVFVGNKSGYNNSSGSNNLFFGNVSGYNNTTGNQNLFIGDSAGYKNVAAYDNVFLGYRTGVNTTTGGNANVFVGNTSGWNNTTGYNNIFVGNNSGFNNTTGYDNAFFGTLSGYTNSTGIQNVFTGNFAGYLNTTGNYNVFTGYKAGYNNTTASNNVFIGQQAGLSNTTGFQNIYIGVNAGELGTTSQQNVFIGGGAGLNNTANVNNGIGYNTGTNLTTGTANSLFGSASGQNITTGSNNAFFGNATGSTITTGSNNTYIGYLARSNGDYTNSAAIGNGAIAGGSNVMVLGNGSLNVGIGLSLPTQRLHVAGGSILTDRSYIASTLNIVASTAAFTVPTQATQIQITDNAGTNGTLSYPAGIATEGQFLWITNNDAQSVTFTSTTPSTIIPTSATMGFVYVNTKWESVNADNANTYNWTTTGNAGTTAGTNFLGTTDAQPLEFKVNSLNAGFIDNGTTSNTSFGCYAGNTPAATGFNNSAFGCRALQSNIIGTDNTAIGVYSLVNNTASFNTAVGFAALWTNNTGSNNTAIGVNSLYSSNGDQNTAVGVSSLNANTGSQNTAVGYLSSQYNTSGRANTAIGLGTLEYNAVGDSNVAVGYYALRGAAVGSNQVSNVALGSYAGLKNNTGTNNVFIGNRSGYNNSSGGNNVFFGFISGYNNTTGATNLFFGNSSGYSNKAASNNIFLGYQSGYNNDATGVGTGSNNLFMGDSTGYSNQTGNNNIFLGNSAGFTNDVAGTGAAVSNVFIGNKAGYYNTTGNSNVFLGTNAGIHNTTGIWNVYEGFLAGANNTTGAGNVCIGLEAGMGSAIQNNGGANVMIGYLAGAKNSGSFNAFTGYSAGFNNTSGAYNTFSGFDAGFNNTTAGYNTFSGYEAGLHNDLGQFNTFIGATAGYTTNSSTAVSNTFVGHSAGYYNTTAGYNTFLGYQSGFNTSTAGYNTFLGYKSGITNTTGTLNAALGQDADFAANNLTNATAIGANAYVGESNAIVLGSMAFVNGSVNDTYVGIGTTTPKNLLTVGPSPTAAAYSSEMFQIARTSDAYMAVRDGTATTVLGTTSGLAFVGTQSNTDFKLVTNNGEKVRITAAGNVGIGTTIPAAVLSVSNTSGSQLTGSSASTTFTTYSGSLGTTLGNTLKLASVGFYSANQSSLGIKAYRTASGTDWTTTAIGLEMDVDATDAVNTASLWLNANGNVGIGTAAPTQAKLVVFGSTNSYLAYAYYNSTGSPGSGGSGTQPFSIYANNRIAAVEFDAFSDARIKRVLGITNNSDDLNTLMKIKVTNYKYIDTIGRGTKLNKKVIAQELEKVYPNAVNQHIDVVPDIYHIADICDGKITVKNNLKECERVKLIFDDRTEIVEVEKADSTGFEVNLKDISATLNASERVFVYGREVNDFRTVDYEALSTLNISATQQLAKENEELKKQVTEQNKSIEQLKEEVKTIQALLNNNSWLLKPSIINNVSVEKK